MMRKIVLWFSIVGFVSGSMAQPITLRAAQGDTVALISGVPQTGSVPPAAQSQTCLLADTQYTLLFPGGANRLAIELRGDTTVNLYVRRNQRVALEAGAIVADFKSEGLSNPVILRLPLIGSPPLEAGTYFIAVGNCDPVRVASFTLTATILAPPVGDTVPLPIQGVEVGSIPAALPGSCALGQTQYTLPAFAPSPCGGGIFYVIELRGDQNVDLYIRFDQRVVVEEGRIVADGSSQSPTASETIPLGPSARNGTYFIAVSNCSAAVANYTISVRVVIADPEIAPRLFACELERSPQGVSVLRVFGTGIRQGATVTINGATPRKVKFKSPEPGGPYFNQVVVRGRVCQNLPGIIRVVNPGSDPRCTLPLACDRSCPD